MTGSTRVSTLFLGQDAKPESSRQAYPCHPLTTRSACPDIPLSKGPGQLLNSFGILISLLLVFALRTASSLRHFSSETFFDLYVQNRLTMSFSQFTDSFKKLGLSGDKKSSSSGLELPRCL